jgi:CHAT domain-containing protein
MTTKRSLYEFHIDLLMQMHKDNPTEGFDWLALQASERARARSLLDMLIESRANIRQGVDASLVEQERKLGQQLSVKSERLTRLLVSKHTEEQERVARREVDVLLGDYHEVEAQLRAKSPRYAALTQPQPLSIKEIQEEVLDDDTVLLEYVLGKERSYLWAVTTASFKSFELPRQAEVEGAAQRVYELLVAKADQLYPEALLNLSKMVLKPAEQQLRKKRLIIVSEGALQYIPFGALPDPNPARERSPHRATSEPLVLNHEVISLPSVSTLAVLRREFSARKPASKTLAVLADPVFETHDERIKPMSSGRGAEVQVGNDAKIQKTALPADLERSTGDLGLDGFDRLVQSRREAELIAALASTGKMLNALDFDASRATATSNELGEYQILHFATHSLLNNQHPELSGIVLSLVDEQGRQQDGFLRLYEIYNLKLGADLVVLSACQTALGKDIKGEGLVGLTRGFMYAGVPRVVASLWKVSDKATSELMKRFYQKMFKERMRPAAALREAQVSMLKDKQWRPAYYWAGFVLQGEWK